jgi:putative ABC transport system substrate-binding protein
MLAVPGRGHAQRKNVFRLGWLSSGDEVSAKPFVDAFRSGMRDLGYDMGRNLAVEIRYSAGDSNRLQSLADELIALNPDVLLGIGSVCLVMAAKTSTIPIVILGTIDPVAMGLVQSLARPGRNVTGMSNLLLTGKHVEILSELAPKLSRVVLLNDASVKQSRKLFEQSAQVATTNKKLALLPIYAAPSPEGIRAAFVQAGSQPGTGVVVALGSPLFGARNLAQLEQFEPRSHVFREAGLNGIIDLRSA